MITDLSYWVLLDFFILEMKTVKDIISADSTEQFEANYNRTQLLRHYVLPALAVSGFTFRFLVSLKLYGAVSSVDHLANTI